MTAYVCVLIACGVARPAEPSHYPYKIVCTTGMVADIVSHVAGDRGEVENIIGAGVDPHLYKSTRADVARRSGTVLAFLIVWQKALPALPLGSDVTRVGGVCIDG